jgi:organic radical activating enzyme
MFYTLAGEGAYSGCPAFFVRLSGCNQKCWFCDTKYHRSGKEMRINEVVDACLDSQAKIIVFTGGEPLLQGEELWLVMMALLKKKRVHLETNGTIYHNKCLGLADYVCVSPKNKRKFDDWLKEYEKKPFLGELEVKVVTDFERVGHEFIEHATSIMPLTTTNRKKDKEIRRKAWEYCVANTLRYSPRLQFEVWGKKRCK